MDASKDVDAEWTPTTRSLPRVLADLARQYPNDTWMTVQIDSSLSGGWRDITYAELSNAVDGMVAWMKSTLGDLMNLGDVVAYMGINDMRYAVVEIALIKAGCRAMLPSPRNSRNGQQSLFRETNCRLLLYSADVEQHIDNVQSALPEVQSFRIPDFDEVRDPGSRMHQVLPDRERTEDDRLIVLHTSGSTGHPKPIHHTNGSINTVGAIKEFPAPQGRQNITDAFLRSDESMLIVAPFFHILGQTMLWRSLLCRAPLVVPSPQKPPNAELVVQAIKKVRPSLAFFPPSILEAITNAPDGLDAISLLETVYFAGGPLATGVGQRLVGCTNLLNMLGSTETGICLSHVPIDKHDWPYFEAIPESGVRMEIDSSGLYEMVIARTHNNKRYQAVFHTFPETREWRTKDLFERHPERNDLWLYKGRKDDMLVLSNGEKFHPVRFEKLVESHPMVKGALVVGQRRFQAGLLIEPDWNAMSPTHGPSELLESLRPTIEKANATSPAHGKMWMSRTAIAKRDKPFVRADKGSIIRRQTVDLYETEIEALYSEQSTGRELSRLPSTADVTTIKDNLRQTLKLIGLEIPDSFSDDSDMFKHGIDSLGVLELCHKVNGVLGEGSAFALTTKDVYRYPTINGLAQMIYSKL